MPISLDGSLGINSSGNVTAPYYYGNGRFLTGIAGGSGNSSAITSGNSSVSFDSNGNAIITINGANVASFSPTGLNIANGNVVADGYFFANGDPVAANLSSITTNLIPSLDLTYTLGNSTNQWKDLWVGGNTIYMYRIPINLSAVAFANGSVGNTLAVGSNPLIASNTDAQLGNLVVSGRVVANTFVSDNFLWSNGVPIITSTGNINAANIDVSGAIAANSVVTNTVTTTGTTTTNALVSNTTTTTGTTTTNALVSNTTTTTGNTTSGNIISLGNTTTVGTTTTNALISNTTTTTGNTTTGNLTSAGSVNSSTIATTGDANVGGNVNAANFTTPGTANIGNLVVPGTTTLVGNATTGNILATGAVTVSGNVTGGNINTAGNAVVQGNVVAGTVVTNSLRGTTVTITATTGGVVFASNANVSMGGSVIRNVQNPVQPQDAATKQYVDDAVQGVSVKQAVTAATTAALPAYNYNNGVSGVGATIVATSPGVLNIDSTGNIIATNDRVLIKNETGVQDIVNGIYVVSATGNVTSSFVLTRSADFNSGTEVSSAFVFVIDGAINQSSGWVCTTPSDPVPAIGSTPITFSQFSYAGGYSAGNGLSLVGTQFNTNVDPETVWINSNNEVGVKPSANLTTPNIGNATFQSLTSAPGGTGNVTANNMSLSGVAAVTGNVSAGNITTEQVTATGNITSTQNMLASGNVSANNLVAINTVAAVTANISGAVNTNTVLATGNIVTTANISGDYILGNGRFLTGMPELYGNANVISLLETGITSNIITTANISTGGILTDNIYYANGQPYVFSTYGNSNVTALFDSGTVTTNVITSGAVETNAVTANLLTVNQFSNLGDLANITIAGGAPNYAILTDGAGNLSWGLAAPAAVPSVYFTANAAGNGQTFSNVILAAYNNAADMNLFYNGALLENSFYTLSGDTVQVNTPLFVGDTISIARQVAGNINNITSGYGDSNVTSLLSGGIATNIVTTGDITANAFIGDGSQLTGLPAGYTDANVEALLSSGNITGNITTSGYYFGNGALLTGIQTTINSIPAVAFTAVANGNSQSFSNVVLGGYTANTAMTVFKNGVLIGNDLYTLAGDVLTINIYLTVGDNINVITQVASNVVSVTSGYGDSNVATLLASGTVSSNISITGNISADYYTGNGSLLTGLQEIVQIPAVYFTAPIGATAQTFSNVVLGSYTSSSALTVFVNGALLENTNYTLAGDVLTLNVYLNAGDAVDVSTQFGGNVTTIVSGYGNSNVAAFFSDFAGDIVPAVDSGYNLGGTTVRWLNAYADNFVGTTVTTTGNIVTGANVNAGGMTINGNAIITGNANVQGTLTFNNTTSITTSNLVLGLGNNQSGINVSGGGIVVGNTAEAEWLYDQPAQTWDTNLGITAAGNVAGAGFNSAGGITALGNVEGANFNTLGVITASGNIDGDNLNALDTITADNIAGNNVFSSDGRLLAANITSPVAGQNLVYDGAEWVNNSSSASGSWTLVPGVNNVSFDAPINGTYVMYVRGNIPNGIVTWTATATVTNNNVPVNGTQTGWYYVLGGAETLVLNSIPAQIVGTAGSIITTLPAVTVPSNRFRFTITNNTGTNQIVLWGYNKQ